MSISISSLLIPLVLLIIIVNFYFRIKIIRQYNQLKSKNISVDIKKLMNKKSRDSYISEEHPEYSNELRSISTNMRNLLIFVIIGFIAIVVSFLIVYLNSSN